MAVWDGALWRWSFEWRRPLFLWEQELVNDMLTLLSTMDGSEEDDSLVWCFNANKIFSVKSFIMQVLSSNQNTSITNLTVGVWAGVAPPKAEILVWLLLLGKLNTKGRLKELNIIRDDQVLCPFCMCQQETISHLFFDCNHTWKIWCSCFSWWGYSWCCHNQPRRFFDHWLGMKLHGFQKKL